MVLPPWGQAQSPQVCPSASSRSGRSFRLQAFHSPASVHLSAETLFTVTYRSYRKMPSADAVGS